MWSSVSPANKPISGKYYEILDVFGVCAYVKYRVTYYSIRELKLFLNNNVTLTTGTIFHIHTSQLSVRFIPFIKQTVIST